LTSGVGIVESDPRATVFKKKQTHTKRELGRKSNLRKGVGGKKYAGPMLHLNEGEQGQRDEEPCD